MQPLLKKFKKAYAQNPYAFKSDPIQQFRDHVTEQAVGDDVVDVVPDLPRLLREASRGGNTEGLLVASA